MLSPFAPPPADFDFLWNANGERMWALGPNIGGAVPSWPGESSAKIPVSLAMPSGATGWQAPTLAQLQSGARAVRFARSTDTRLQAVGGPYFELPFSVWLVVMVTAREQTRWLGGGTGTWGVYSTAGGASTVAGNQTWTDFPPIGRPVVLHANMQSAGDGGAQFYVNNQLVSAVGGGSAPGAGNRDGITVGGLWARSAAADLTGYIGAVGVTDSRVLSSTERDDLFRWANAVFVQGGSGRPPAPPAPPPTPAVAHRRGRLVLGTYVVPLDDFDQGWACQELDLGYPAVREVSNNRPDQWGTDDQTTLFGARPVSANITAWRERMTVDDIASRFAPFMNVAARPQLFYTVESAELNERFLTLRPADFASAMTSPAGSGSIRLRSIHLAWIAPDPIAYDAEESVVTAWAGSSVRQGRRYNTGDGVVTGTVGYQGGPPGTAVSGTGWRPDRRYPQTGRDPSVGQIVNRGEFPVRPILTVVGQITGPRIAGNYLDPANGVVSWQIVTTPSLVVGTGQSIVIDTVARTVMTGDCTSLLSYVRWQDSNWPAIPPGATSTLTITGTSTDENANVEARWRNGYLT